ncbi:hypothetical protein [Mangrovicoccus ximenensis]|uniref:hypothetical protein n=1 Tax=Mangrovicoccus ximenensis TaxID=1911570 RepID=UPI000D3C66E8|nr:hypothetical protein [Mangrovicoccus ximenensis]
MSDVHEWCKSKYPRIKAMVDSFYESKPDRELRAPTQDASNLIRIAGEIESVVSTLKYVRRPTSPLADLAGIVGNERTPDHAFFGPAPNLNVADAGGFASAAGLAADLGGALLAVFKGAREEAKLSASLGKDGTARSEYKIGMLRNYETLVQLLLLFAEMGAGSEDAAKKLNKNGLNVPILNNAWRVMSGNRWLVLAG